MALEQVQIALGYNNVGGLQKWWQIAPPAFYRYRPLQQLTVWAEQEGQHNNSLGLPTDYGQAYVDWVFGGLTEDEYQIVRSFKDKQVTIHTYAKTAKAWKNFNGIFTLPSPTAANWRANHWLDIRPRILFLEEIEP